MNYHDVALLNGSLDEISDTLLKRKMLEEQSRERAAQTDLQKQRLQVDQDRWNKTAAFQNRMEAKADQANDLAKTRADLQDKQKFLQQVMMLNSAGQIQDLSKVNKWLSDDPHFGATGIQLQPPTQKTQTRQGLPSNVSTTLYLKDFRDQANALRDPNSPDFDPDKADEIDHYGDLLESSMKKTDRNDGSVTEEVDYPAEPEKPAVPADPGSNGVLGFGARPATPGSPAVPAKPKRKVTIKHPAGWRPDATGPSDTNAVPDVPDDKTSLVKGQKYNTARGIATWDGTQFVK